MDKHYLKRPTHDLTGLWLTLAVLIFVGGWRLWIIAHEPAHWATIGREIGSIAQFREDLYPNKDGTRVVFSQDTEKGVGLFFCDADSAKTKILCEQNEEGYSNQRFGMLGWSPDGKLFAYAFPNNPKQQQEEVVICDGISGEAMGKMPVDAGLTELAWLSPRSFAHLNYNQDISVHEQKSDGTWIKSHFYPKIASETLQNSRNSFTAISENSVVWQRGNEIWRLDFDTSAFKKIWGSTTNKLQGFTYSRETGEFQLACFDKSGWYLINLDQQGAVLGVSHDERRKKYAYLRDEAGLNTFYVKTDANSLPNRIVWEGAVEDHIGPIGDYQSSGKYMYGDYLYFIGTLPEEPVGLWQYRINDGESRCLVSGLKHSLSYARIVAPEGFVITNALGKQTSCHVWQPVNVIPGKKYPLILTQTTYGWSPFQQVAAQEGYYFGVVHRSYWNDETIYNWTTDVMTLYTILAKNPNVDTNRVYLFGTSWDTTFLSQLMAEQPDLWEGAILINPSILPKLSVSHGSKLFIVAGKDQRAGFEWLTKYQDEAARLGIPVTLMLQKGSQHIPRSVTTERGRIMQFTKFLIEN
jgi:hypothetical protein